MKKVLGVVVWCCALFMTATCADGQDRAQATARLNLRPCPTCPPAQRLKAGTEMLVLGLSVDGDWYNVQVMPKGETGWVSSRYVEVLPPTPPPAPYEHGLVHQRAIRGFFLVGLAGVILSFVALRASRQRDSMPFFTALLSNPKIVISWFFLLESGIAGLIVLTTRLLNAPAELHLKGAALCGYIGWSLFWGFPPFRHLIRKGVPWLIAWLPAPALFLLIPFLPGLAFLYSVLGGGLLHFILHCWAIGKAAPSGAPARAAEPEPKPEPKLGEPKLEEAKPLGNRWQLEHPEW